MTTLFAPASTSARRSHAPALPVEHAIRKMKASSAVKSVLGRVLHPVHLWRAASLQKNRKANRRLFDDNRLALYQQMLSSDFLHYGYFDDATTCPKEISLADLARAQVRYAERLLDLLGAPAGPVLDAGCGMGGLSRMLLQRGLSAVALTPDRLQAGYVAKSLPDVPVLRCKFEAMPLAENAHRYGAVLMAESLQYMKLDKALQVLDAVLQPTGTWVACDYFLTRASSDRTCHNWDTFREQTAAAGWRITHREDITPHIAPTLAFLHMLATRFGLPLMEFATLRLRRKQPGLHHLLAGLLDQLNGVATDNVGLINPAQFAQDRQYLLLKMER